MTDGLENFSVADVVMITRELMDVDGKIMEQSWGYTINPLGFYHGASHRIKMGNMMIKYG